MIAGAVPVAAARPAINVRRQQGPAPAVDAFPYTRRPLPWLVAAFLGVLWLVPIDSTSLRVNLPFDSKFDRFVVLGLVLAWMLSGGDQRTFSSRRRSKLFAGAAVCFVVVAVASVLTGGQRIALLNEFTLSEKRLALLLTFAVVGWFIMTALRPEDLRGISRYMVGLATVMAVGMILERRTGYNPFYEIDRVILKPLATIAPSPTDIHPAYNVNDRVTVVGPTLHGLAATSMLAMAMPFALVGLWEATNRRPRVLYALAFALMMAGAMATEKKAAVVAPLAVIVFLAFHRPRAMLKLLPLGVVLLGFVHAASPGALGSILDIGHALNSNSTSHRSSDYAAVLPDVLAHPVLGRGYGTIDIAQSDQFRILDNEYLGELMQVGFVGLAAYLFLIVAPIILARRAVRSGDPARAGPALAASAGCVAYLAVNGLFDTLSFPQAPYMFFVVASMCTVASGRLGEDDAIYPRKASIPSAAPVAA